MGNSQRKEGNSQPKKKGSFSHEHTLFHYYVENRSTKEQCDVCSKEIYGLVYACQVCNFTRHGSCAQEEMPLEITHPSHSMHELQLQNESSDFLCERCFYNSRGPRYHCDDCSIDVDLACVSSTTDQPSRGEQGLIPAGRARKRTRHLCHGQPLALFKYRKATQQFELDCSWCDKRLSGMSYGCFKGGPSGCKFFLHESCISKISKRVLHPFHPLHYLYVQYSKDGYSISCNACRRSASTVSLTTYYACHECRFYLHISCARLQPTLKHKCHEHHLTYFSRSTDRIQRSFNCRACGHNCDAKRNKEAAFYRCVQCDFNIHFRCLPAPPIAKHRYHLHFLILRHEVIEDDYCDICEEERNPKHHIYYCRRCKFIAHVECVLKKVSDNNVRKMMRLVKRVQQSNGEFPKLKETGDKNQLFKMQEIQFLLKDLEEEKKEKKMERQKYFEEDISAEKCTSSDDDDVDEEDKVDEEEDEESSDEGEQENEEKEEKNGATQEEASTSVNETKELTHHPLNPLKNLALEIHHFNHKHPLKIFHLTKKYEDGDCVVCGEELRGIVYICPFKKSSFHSHYGLHKACTELPYELQHPHHSQHALTLLAEFPHSRTTWFLCDECRDFSDTFVYLCMDCPFKVDVKCAVLDAPKIGIQHPKHREKETKLFHFSHDEHVLVLGNLVHTTLPCVGCNLPILGPAYCCLDCRHTIHESCLSILPQKIQHPFHPLHPLVAFSGYSSQNKCHACKMGFEFFARGFPSNARSFYSSSSVCRSLRYGCLRCELDLHFVCANSLRRVLKSNSHKHNLYYFGPDNQLFLNHRFGLYGYFDFSCSTCTRMCRGPFYRCVECALNFHLKCIPVPQKIKCKCHLHHLILKDSFIEDDIGEYYCDICEEERHPKDHIYYCEECHGFFVTHIECVLSMELEQVKSFDKDEKNDDDNNHEEGSEAKEVQETSPEITTISKLESEFETPPSRVRANLFTRGNKGPFQAG